MTTDVNTIFISYSWDSNTHKAWVEKLATSLEEYKEFHIKWDGFDLDATIDKNQYMESGVFQSDKIIVVATNKYKTKADTRQGGVGIETHMATAAHWECLQCQDKSKIIVIKREEDSIPNYLKGSIYIDFSDDDKYSESETELIQALSEASKRPRPKKVKSISSTDHTCRFTKFEDIIKLGNPNRRSIVDSNQGTDYSEGNRIKYEIWEVKKPMPIYYIIMAHNINIRQTITHAIKNLESNGIRPSDLTVLRPRPGRIGEQLVQSIFNEYKSRITIHEYTYKDYVWEFCIDDSLKSVTRSKTSKYYTNQSLQTTTSTNEHQLAPSALDYFVHIFEEQNPHTTAAHLLVATGGMGKSSLCSELYNKLLSRSDLHSSIVMISADNIKKHTEYHNTEQLQLNSLYALYNLHAMCTNDDKALNQPTFDLAFLCGNIQIIVDGLDEFESLFPETFSLDAFLSTLSDSHHELGNTTVLLTTRNSELINSELLNKYNIQRHDLLGFDKNCCTTFLNKRFRHHPNPTPLIEKVLLQIDGIKLKDDDGRIVPFFADILATITEDSIGECSYDFEIRNDSTPYPSNNDLVDYIIHSIIRREIRRQDFDIDPTQIIELISYCVVEYGNTWPTKKVKEYINLMYDSTNGERIYSKLSINPLLTTNDNFIELKYAFLSSYFEVLYIIGKLTNSSVETEFLKALSGLNTESFVFKEITKYFKTTGHAKLIDFEKSIISNTIKHIILTEKPKTNPETTKKAIASLLNIAAHVINGDAQQTTDLILKIYNIIPENNKQIILNNVYIGNGFPPMDFSNMIISSSLFNKYHNFLRCRFGNTKFIYCQFKECHNEANKKSDLTPEMIENTCDMGDLKTFIHVKHGMRHQENKLIESELSKFLNGFYHSGFFRDQKIKMMQFSQSVEGLCEKRFTKLIQNGYISLSHEKMGIKYYIISQDFQDSVSRFMQNNQIDSRMKSLISLIKST